MQILQKLAMQDNVKPFSIAPAFAPALAFLPATGNVAFDSAVLIGLLTHPVCAPLLRRLLEWQNRLRVLLLDLFAARRDISKVRLATATVSRGTPFLSFSSSP